MFKYSNKYVFEDDFVRLSPLKKEHIQNLKAISNQDNLWTYFIENGKGLKNLTNYIELAIDNRKRNKEYAFVIFDKVKKQYAGTTRFYDYLPDLKSIKLGHTWIGQEFRGTKLNKHCKYLLLKFAFEKLKVERVGFGAHSENKISILAMKSIGCVQEGVLRHFIPSVKEDKRADIVLLSILKSEWQNSVKKKIEQKLNYNI